MIRLIVRPNDEGKNGPGMWVRYNKSQYKLDALALERGPAMGCPVWALPVVRTYDTPQQPSSLLLHTREGVMIGSANLTARRIE